MTNQADQLRAAIALKDEEDDELQETFREHLAELEEDDETRTDIHG